MTDLDALTALLAAAISSALEATFGPPADGISTALRRAVVDHAVNGFRPALIEAARREAELREVLAVLVHEVDPSAVGTAVATRTFSGSMGLALERARALLHDNAGATLPAEGTE